MVAVVEALVMAMIMIGARFKYETLGIEIVMSLTRRKGLTNNSNRSNQRTGQVL